VNPLVTDWMQAWAAIVTGGLGIIGAGFIIWQMNQIGHQLRNSTLTNVLSLEADMNSRKAKLDDINNDIERANSEGKLAPEMREVMQKYMNAAIENWLNAVDRLCFCIKNDYLKEKDWKAEYRDYIVDLVKQFEPRFGAASKYKNIIDINEKWLRE